MGCCQCTHEYSLDFNEMNIKTDPDPTKPLRSTRDIQYELSEFNDISLDSELEEDATQLKQIRYGALTESCRDIYTTPEKSTLFSKLTNSFNIEEAIIHKSPKNKDSSHQFFHKSDARNQKTPRASFRKQQISFPFRQYMSKPCSFVNTPILINSQEENLRGKMHYVEEDEPQFMHTL